MAMPDRRKHRGRHPEDERLFAERRHEALRTAVSEYSWLLTRGYAADSALKLVGDRHGLTARQRLAVRRSTCSDDALRGRAARQRSPEEAAGRAIAVDGYNLLITVESALSGGLILVGQDGCHRDLASVHGTYRKVEETVPALELILDHLATLNAPRVDWYLDKPVANSGRLKTLLAELVASRPIADTGRAEWNIELVNSPDRVLAGHASSVVTSDSVILDACDAWLNLAADLITTRCPGAWIVDLRT
jgi:hypothetical protein